MNTIILCIIIFFSHLVIATQEIEHNPFDVFFPHLGASLCRKNAYEIAIQNISSDKKIELWVKYKNQCSSDGSYQLILGDRYLSYGSYSKAKKILENSITNVIYDTRYHKLLLHGVYLGLNEIEKANNLSKNMIKEYPNWHGGFTALGIDYFNMKKYHIAKEYFDKAILLDDKDPDTYLMLASVCYELSDDEKVLEYYKKAFKLDPIKPFLDRRSSAVAVIVLVNKREFKEAKNILDTQQEIDPTVIKEDRFIRVKKYYEDALAKKNAIYYNPYPFDIYYPHLGGNICRKKAYEILAKKTSLERKFEQWENYEKQCSSDGSYQLLLGDFYLTFGYYNEAKNFLESILIKSNYDIKYHKLLLHGAYRALGQIEKSRNLAIEMINTYPDWYGGYSCLGNNFFDQKKWSTAKKYFEKSIMLNNKKSYTYLKLASISYELKEDDKVLEYYEEAFKLNSIEPFLDRRSSAVAVIVLVNKGEFKEAKNILDTQQEIDPTVVREDRFIRVKKYYEDALKKFNDQNKKSLS